jgi:hypothetical protein
MTTLSLSHRVMTWLNLNLAMSTRWLRVHHVIGWASAPILIKCTLHFRVLVINRAIHMMNLTVVVLENTSLMGSTANSYLFIYY